MEITFGEKSFLEQAHDFLENPTLLMSMSNSMGKPLEYGINKLPEKAQDYILKTTRTALIKSLEISYKTLSPEGHYKPEEIEEMQIRSQANKLIHNGLNVLTGTAGGFFGNIGLVVELPLSTSVIMRSILAEGMNYSFHDKDELIAESMYVFTLGSPAEGDDEMDSAYFSSRYAFNYLVQESARALASSGSKSLLSNLHQGSTSVLLNFIAKVAKRYNIAVTNKVLAGSLPILGAIGSASLNYLFTDYYSNAARYHFGIKYLEKKYGQEMIQEQYESLKTTED